MHAMIKNSTIMGLVVSAFAFAGPQDKTLTSGINSLGYRVLGQIQTAQPNENLFLSAFSIHEAMSMVYSGAEGATRKELAESVLGIAGNRDAKWLANEWELLRKELVGADEKVTFRIANSMWGNADQKVKFQSEFVSLNQQGHDAEVRSEDFQEKKVVDGVESWAFIDTVHKWVSEKTEGKITKVLSPPIRKDQLFYLINAIYFKGAWDVEFDKKLTKKQNFQPLRGAAQSTAFMNRTGYFQYFTDNNSVEAVQIPFGKTKRMNLSVYLPNQKTAAGKKWLNNVSATSLQKVAFRARAGSIALPRFGIEYTNEQVVEILQALKLRKLFTDAAELDGIAQGEASKINKIIHKAVIEVTEEGAEAAAVTVVGGIRATSAEPELPPFKFVANRPFYFEIRDNVTDVVLFSGVVHQPKDPKAKS